MAISGLPKVGVQAIVEGVQTFVKDMNSVNKAIDSSGTTSAAAAKKVGALPTGLDDAAKAVDGLRGQLSNFIKDSVPFGNQLGGIVDYLVAIPLPALAAVAAIVALGAAFLALGNRGAPLQEIGIAFDNITASVGITSQTLLKDLRAASEGTIADFDLIKTASTALIGTTGELGKTLGEKLPDFLRIAKVQADATGKSVNELFNNLVEGVKKGTPKLIESTGLIIDQKAAYQDYAKALGVTVAQLSDTDKSMALLNATLTAGAASIDTLGNSVESNADKLDRQNATITNIFDGLAIAVQPAFGVVLDATQKVLDIFQQLATAVGPIFGGIVSIIANVFSTIIDIVTAVVQPIVDVISSIAPYFALAFQTVANIIGSVGKIIGDVIGGIVKFLSDVAKNFFGLDLKNLGPQLFNGAAAAFGSFANGIIKVANTLIFPAVIAIAKFIADFLIGFSPPKEGPLSVIDKGGENLMKSWLEGISGVSLDPVKQVAKEVSDALGSIGKQNLVAVTTRLGQLDKALLPFQNRLDIIKGQFDALNAPAKAALDAIQRQSNALQDAVAQGDPQAVEKLKVLDAQREAIQKQVDLEQGLVDRAQIQLGLKQAQQAPERALLAIRKAQLEALLKGQVKEGATSSGGASVPKEKKAAGAGGVISPTGGTGGVVAPTGGLPSVLDLIGGQDAVDQAAAGLSEAFNGAIDQSGLEDFAQNSLDLGSQIDRIKSVDLGSKITDKFKGLTDAFDPNNPDSITSKVAGFLRTLTGDESTEGSIASFFSDIPGHLQGAQSKINDALNNIALLFDPTIPGSFAAQVNVHIQDLTGGLENPNSIVHFLANLPANLDAAKPDILASFHSFATDLFDPDAKGSFASNVVSLVGSLTGDDTQAGKVADFFRGLPDRITEALSNLLTDLKTKVFIPISDYLTGDGPNTLGDILNQVVSFFTNLPSRIGIALGGIGAAIRASFITPVINGINSLIGLVETGMKGLIDKTAGFVQSIIDALGEVAPQFLKDAAMGLHAAAASVNFGRIPLGNPVIGPPRAATGGMFGPGLVQVGERGPELMFNASKVGIIPNDLTNVLMSLQSILAQPQPMPVYGGGNSSTSNTSNQAFNFNGVQSDNDARRRYNYLRAGMR